MSEINKVKHEAKAQMREYLRAYDHGELDIYVELTDKKRGNLSVCKVATILHGWYLNILEDYITLRVIVEELGYEH